MDKDVVICKGCKYYRRETVNPAGSLGWYNHRCGHPSARRTEVDYTLGIEKSEQAYCRDMNPDGKCKLFEKEA